MLDNSIIKRFWRLTKRNSSGYLIWDGSVNVWGYGQMTLKTLRLKRHTFAAHRIAFEIYKGRPPKDCVLHRCDRPECVDERCLYEGSQKDNVVDAVRKGRMAIGDKNANAKLTEQQVRAIRALAKQTSRKELGLLYGLSTGCIDSVVTRRRWPHIA